jgi:glutamine synthetase
MFQNAEEAKRFIANADVKFVDVRFCDVPGIMQHFTVPVEIFDPEGELAFDGSSIRGFQEATCEGPRAWVRATSRATTSPTTRATRAPERGMTSNQSPPTPACGSAGR